MPNVNGSQSCDNCKFFHQEGQSMVCRRYPPKTDVIMVPPKPPHIHPRQAQHTYYPPVIKQMWCGEWGLNITVAPGNVVIDDAG